MTRKAALAKLHIARKDLGLSEDDYRAALIRATGKRSASQLDDGEREAALAEFRRMGWSGAPPLAPRAGRADGKYAQVLRALWLSAYNLGAVEAPGDAALTAFVERQTKISHTRFLTHAADAARVIEALKSMLARHGVEWPVAREPAVRDRKVAVIRAQARRLSGQTPGWTLAGDLAADPDSYFAAASATQLDRLSSRLGTMIRGGAPRDEQKESAA